jgi:hypothetical protein
VTGTRRPACAPPRRPTCAWEAARYFVSIFALARSVSTRSAQVRQLASHAASTDFESLRFAVPQPNPCSSESIRGSTFLVSDSKITGMKLVPINRPVTIHSVRFGERWFPQLHRHTDRTLMLGMNWGHDAHFAPSLHMWSLDNGQTWSEPMSNVPRRVFAHSLANDDLFEIDEVGIMDPKAPETFVFWGCWSSPGTAGEREGTRLARCSTAEEPERNFVRMHLPSIKSAPRLWQRTDGKLVTAYFWCTQERPQTHIKYSIFEP